MRIDYHLHSSSKLQTVFFHHQRGGTRACDTLVYDFLIVLGYYAFRINIGIHLHDLLWGHHCSYYLLYCLWFAFSQVCTT